MQKTLKTAMAGAAAAASMTSVHAIEASDILMYQKGPLVLKPQFALTETFNDNITYRHTHQLADLLTVISPELDLQVGRKDFNFFTASYAYDRILYADNDQFDANQHHITARLHFQKRRLTLDGNDSIDFLSSPLGGGFSSGETANSTEGVAAVGGSKISRANFFDLYRLTWEMSDRTALYAQFLHSFNDYEDDIPLYDSRTITGTLGFEYHPFQKAYFFGETYYGETETLRNLPVLAPYPTADFLGFFVGARGNFTEHLKGMLKAGYEHRFYSDRGASFDAPVVEMSVDYQLSDHTLFSAGYSRRQYESVQFVRSPYVTDSLFFTWVQQIGADGRLKSILRANYLDSSFDQSGQVVQNREDQIINASLTISYDIKLWMRAFGSYNFEHLNSNDPGIVNYNVNRITAGLQIGY